MSLTEPQVRLLRRRMRGWMVSDFLANFDAARSRAVASMSSGSYWEDGRRDGWYETTSKGWQVVRWEKDKPREVLVSLTWSEIRAWVNSVDDATRARCIAITGQIRDLNENRRDYGWRRMLDGETRDEYLRARCRQVEEVAAHNKPFEEAVFALEVERDQLIEATMPEPAGEQLDLFDGAA